MFTYIKKIFPFFICLLAFACKKNDSFTTASEGVSGTLTSNVTSLTLSRATASDTVIQFNWTPATFGYDAAITQNLQFAVAGTNFQSVFNYQLDNNTTEAKITGSVLNAGVRTLGISLDTATTLEVRLASSISSGFDSSYTPSIKLKILPYQAESYLYVPGDYNGWTFSTTNALVSENSDGIYIGIIDFTKGTGFKLSPAPNWNFSYGAGSTSGTIDPAGGNITAPNAAKYQLTVNTTAKTIVYVLQE